MLRCLVSCASLCLVKRIEWHLYCGDIDPVTCKALTYVAMIDAKLKYKPQIGGQMINLISGVRFSRGGANLKIILICFSWTSSFF